MSTGREIRLVEEDDGWWSAIDEETGVASQGPSRAAALDNLDEAVALHTNTANERVENESEVLEDFGIDADEIDEARDDNEELPDFVR